MTKLPSGQYYIRNKDTFAGRNRIEDRSNNPKKVFCPTDSQDPELWDLELLPNGHYKLSARGAPTGVIHKHLYAFLVEPERAEEWVITKREDHQHRPQYTIEKADKTGGWVRQTDVDDPQVAVNVLAATPSIPPHFAGVGLWNIQPLVD